MANLNQFHCNSDEKTTTTDIHSVNVLSHRVEAEETF